MISKSIQNLTGLASYLAHEKILESKLAAHLQQEAKQQEINFVNYLVQNKILSSQMIFEICKKNFGTNTFDLKNYNTKWLENSPISEKLIKQYRIIPLNIDNHIFHLGVADPTDRHTLDIIAFYTGLSVTPMIVQDDQITHFIETHFSSFPTKKLETNLLQDLALEENPNIIQENPVNYDEPVIRFVDHLIRHALQQSVSDIHIEPYETICRLRYRRDGILYETAEIPIQLAARLITRLKVMSKLDISERRLPQDGRFQLHNIDIRINSCPTLFGEKIVLRLLDFNKMSLQIDELGLTEKQQHMFINTISQSQGLILVTGPTGSGKTVTLYSALHYLNNSEKNISTVEDPVEIQLNGINQVNIHPKIGLHFATILRTFLRQDPDIIMLGEIRDLETAEIAIQAAHTGHLVLSTLHTNSAIETISRLHSIGIPIYNICTSISLIIAQRLVRKLCVHCKQAEIISPQLLNEMGFPIIEKPIKIYRAVGCDFCLNGYHGRIGIYEFLPITENISKKLLAGTDPLHLLTYLKQENFISLYDMALEKISLGITSIAEINRVLKK